MGVTVLPPTSHFQAATSPQTVRRKAVQLRNNRRNASTTFTTSGTSHEEQLKDEIIGKLQEILNDATAKLTTDERNKIPENMQKQFQELRPLIMVILRMATAKADEYPEGCKELLEIVAPDGNLRRTQAQKKTIDQEIEDAIAHLEKSLKNDTRGNRVQSLLTNIIKRILDDVQKHTGAIPQTLSELINLAAGKEWHSGTANQASDPSKKQKALRLQKISAKKETIGSDFVANPHSEKNEKFVFFPVDGSDISTLAKQTSLGDSPEDQIALATLELSFERKGLNSFQIDGKKTSKTAEDVHLMRAFVKYIGEVQGNKSDRKTNIQYRKEGLVLESCCWEITGQQVPKLCKQFLGYLKKHHRGVYERFLKTGVFTQEDYKALWDNVPSSNSVKAYFGAGSTDPSERPKWLKDDSKELQQYNTELDNDARTRARQDRQKLKREKKEDNAKKLTEPKFINQALSAIDEIAPSPIGMGTQITPTTSYEDKVKLTNESELYKSIDRFTQIQTGISLEDLIRRENDWDDFSITEEEANRAQKPPLRKSDILVMFYKEMVDTGKVKIDSTSNGLLSFSPEKLVGKLNDTRTLQPEIIRDKNFNVNKTRIINISPNKYADSGSQPPYQIHNLIVTENQGRTEVYVHTQSSVYETKTPLPEDRLTQAHLHANEDGTKVYLLKIGSQMYQIKADEIKYNDFETEKMEDVQKISQIQNETALKQFPKGFKFGKSGKDYNPTDNNPLSHWDNLTEKDFKGLKGTQEAPLFPRTIVKSQEYDRLVVAVLDDKASTPEEEAKRNKSSQSAVIYDKVDKKWFAVTTQKSTVNSGEMVIKIGDSLGLPLDQRAGSNENGYKLENKLNEINHLFTENPKLLQEMKELDETEHVKTVNLMNAVAMTPSNSPLTTEHKAALKSLEGSDDNDIKEIGEKFESRFKKIIALTTDKSSDNIPCLTVDDTGKINGIYLPDGEAGDSKNSPIYYGLPTGIVIDQAIIKKAIQDKNFINLVRIISPICTKTNLGELYDLFEVNKAYDEGKTSPTLDVDVYREYTQKYKLDASKTYVEKNFLNNFEPEDYKKLGDKFEISDFKAYDRIIVDSKGRSFTFIFGNPETKRVTVEEKDGVYTAQCGGVKVIVDKSVKPPKKKKVNPTSTEDTTTPNDEIAKQAENHPYNDPLQLEGDVETLLGNHAITSIIAQGVVDAITDNKKYYDRHIAPKFIKITNEMERRYSAKPSYFGDRTVKELLEAVAREEDIYDADPKIQQKQRKEFERIQKGLAKLQENLDNLISDENFARINGTNLGALATIIDGNLNNITGTGFYQEDAEQFVKGHKNALSLFLNLIDSNEDIRNEVIESAGRRITSGLGFTTDDHSETISDVEDITVGKIIKDLQVKMQNPKGMTQDDFVQMKGIIDNYFMRATDEADIPVNYTGTALTKVVRELQHNGKAFEDLTTQDKQQVKDFLGIKEEKKKRRKRDMLLAGVMEFGSLLKRGAKAVGPVVGAYVASGLVNYRQNSQIMWQNLRDTNSFYSAAYASGFGGQMAPNPFMPQPEYFPSGFSPFAQSYNQGNDWGMPQQAYWQQPQNFMPQQAYGVPHPAMMQHPAMQHPAMQHPQYMGGAGRRGYDDVEVQAIDDEARRKAKNGEEVQRNQPEVEQEGDNSDVGYKELVNLINTLDVQEAKEEYEKLKVAINQKTENLEEYKRIHNLTDVQANNLLRMLERKSRSFGAGQMGLPTPQGVTVQS